MKKAVSLLLSVILIMSICFSGCSANKTVSLDYSDDDLWAYREVDVKDKDADVFFICPSVYSSTDTQINMPIDDEDAKASFLGAINMEKGIYDGDCRMFAPYYRQVGLGGYDLDSDEREPYLLSAYEDIKSSFEYYLENFNDGRPFILAGFSQGADMCIRLLKDYFDDEELSEQLIACYAIGWSITQDELDEYEQLKFATGESDTGVIISFNSEAEDVNSSLMIPSGTKTLAINPLNWKTDSTIADKSLNKGACFTDYEGNITTEIKNLTGAYIDDNRGALKVTDVSADDYPAVLSFLDEGVYHLYDYQFFYRNLQENVQVRIDSYLSK